VVGVIFYVSTQESLYKGYQAESASTVVRDRFFRDSMAAWMLSAFHTYCWVPCTKL
jgi:hypothetical protein